MNIPAIVLQRKTNRYIFLTKILPTVVIKMLKNSSFSSTLSPKD